MIVKYFGRVACLLIPTDHKIRVDGVTYRFEMPSVPTGGPMVIGKKGEILETQPGNRHPFWVATSLWAQGGFKTCPNGFAVWRPESTTLYVHKGGRHYLAKAEVFQPEWCCQGANQAEGGTLAGGA